MLGGIRTFSQVFFLSILKDCCLACSLASLVSLFLECFSFSLNRATSNSKQICLFYAGILALLSENPTDIMAGCLLQLLSWTVTSIISVVITVKELDRFLD